MSSANELKKYIDGGRAVIWPESYAVVTATRATDECFATIRDQNETTLVIREEKLASISAEKVEKEWRIITFDMVLPFGVVGFLAYIAQALAEASIPIFALSAYSTDHILVKQDNLESAVKVLQSLGLIVEDLEPE